LGSESRINQTLGLRFVLLLDQQFPPSPAGPPDYAEARSSFNLFLLYLTYYRFATRLGRFSLASRLVSAAALLRLG